MGLGLPMLPIYEVKVAKVWNKIIQHCKPINTLIYEKHQKTTHLLYNKVYIAKLYKIKKTNK